VEGTGERNEEFFRNRNWHKPREDDPHAPNALIYTSSGEDRLVTSHLMEASWVDTVDLPSEMKLKIASPRGVFADYASLAEGSEIELWLGYGEERFHVGRGEIIASKLSFTGEIPIYEVTAYDKSWLMKRKALTLAGAEREPRRKREAEGEKYEGFVGNYVEDMAARYGFATLISSEFFKIKDSFHRPKMQTDWQILQSLANFYNASCRVYWSHGLQHWLLAFEKNTLSNVSGRGYDQEKYYTFVYFDGEDSTLINPTFESAIDDQVTEIQAYFWDPQKKTKAGTLGQWVLITDDNPELPEKKANTKQREEIPKLDKDGKPIPSRKPPRRQAFPQEPTRMKIAAGGYALEIADLKFKNASDAAQWAKSWFERNRDSFIICTATVPGIEIFAGEHHALAGDDIGKYAGLYYFAKVVHTYGPNGYMVEFTGRRIIQ
jgi:hypothetical protein